MTRRATGGIRKIGTSWWLRYTVAGVRYEENAETGDERMARSLLVQRRREIADGTWKPPTERKAVQRVEAARTALEAALEAAPEAKPLTLAGYLDAWLARRRMNGIRGVRDEERFAAKQIKPAIGHLALREVTRVQVRDLIATLSATKSAKTGKTFSPRYVRSAYGMLAVAFADAVLDGLVVASPCTLRTRKGELPKKKDADAAWRAKAVYTREEAELLLSDDRVPDDRRVTYALQLLAGLRGAEANGRRWRDLDLTARPLARLLVATQQDGARGDRETKTDTVRDVPVHPTLAAILADWKLRGFPVLFGRPPEPDDPIVPSRNDVTAKSFRSATGAFERLVEDLERTELRSVPSPRHAMRATFLSLLEVDGANMAIARRATHAAPVDVVGGYIRTSWPDLCNEIAKLKIQRRGVAEVRELRRAAANESGKFGDFSGSRDDSSSKTMGDAGLEPATSTV